MSTNIAPGKAFPDEDYHGHPNYTKIYLSLLILFTISLAVGMFTSPLVAVILIFLTAIIKAVLVIGNFMHLKFEPKLVWLVLGVFTFIIFVFYWSVFPDITLIEWELAK